MEREFFYLVHNNTVDLILTEDGVALTATQMGAINRMTFQFKSTILDSDVVGEGAGQPFDWVTGAATGKVVFDLAGQSIPKGTYRAELIVYSSDNPLGIIWEKIPIKVVNVSYTPVV